MKLYQEQSDEIDVLKVCVWGAIIFMGFYIAFGILSALFGVLTWNL